MVTNILLFFQPLPFLWYKGLPSYDFATLVGIAIVGILYAPISPYVYREIGTQSANNIYKSMRYRAPPPIRRVQDWDRYYMYVGNL